MRVAERMAARAFIVIKFGGDAREHLVRGERRSTRRRYLG